MTPAIVIAEKKKLPHTVHEYVHESGVASYGEEAAEKLGVAVNQVYKTLVVRLNSDELVVAVIPVAQKLSMKLIAKAAGAKRAGMASPCDVERSTGYVLGGVSPLGQKRRLRTFVDESAKSCETVFVSAGRRGLEIELSPDNLVASVSARYADICQ